MSDSNSCGSGSVNGIEERSGRSIRHAVAAPAKVGKEMGGFSPSFCGSWCSSNSLEQLEDELPRLLHQRLDL